MTDRVHFDDLTKIDVPLGRLDDDTYNRLLAHDGPIEVSNHRDIHWRCVAYSFWLPHLCYRVKPQPLTKPQVPWEHMADWVQYVARDENGLLYAYREKPFMESLAWYGGGRGRSLGAFKIDPGTCDWRDSLVKRPEGL